MVAVVFLILCFLVGVSLLSLVWRGNKTVLLAGGFLVGVLVCNWAVYLATYLFGSLLMANALVFILGLGWLAYVRRRLFASLGADSFHLPGGHGWVVAIMTILIFGFLFYYTFRVEGSELLVGATVFSDFGPHLALIRSFSLGNNFPTVYPHFPVGDVGYHFMFDFAVGNLEFLGARIDHAFNLLSLLSAVSFCLLLFELAKKITGSVGVGILTLVLWFFRSSLAFWNYVAVSGWGGLWRLKEFIGETNHEDWGLWNQNVYLNQRHLLFAWGVLILVLILLASKKKRQEKEIVFGGVVLGLLGFWNGAVVIAGLLMLGAMMVLFKRWRLAGAIALAGFLVYLQKAFFIHEAEMNIKYLFGFLAEEKNLQGVFLYYAELLGVWLVVMLASLILFRKHWRLMLVFMAPFALANTISLTPDVTVNHKYVMISIGMVNIFVAWFLVRVWRAPLRLKAMLGARGVLGKVVSVGLLFLLTVTGMADVASIVNMNRQPLRYQQGEFFEWIKENTQGGEVFLTEDMPVNNEILLGGRYVYYGWPYYAWSAGYDTREREKTRDIIYENKDWNLAKDEGIDYVVYENEEMGVGLEEVYKDDLRVVFKI